jgi:hypothetical protein
VLPLAACDVANQQIKLSFEHRTQSPHLRLTSRYFGSALAGAGSGRLRQPPDQNTGLDFGRTAAVGGLSFCDALVAIGPSLPLATRQLLDVDRTSVLLSGGRRLSVLLDPQAAAGRGAGGDEDGGLMLDNTSVRRIGSYWGEAEMPRLPNKLRRAAYLNGRSNRDAYPPRLRDAASRHGRERVASPRHC